MIESKFENDYEILNEFDITDFINSYKNKNNDNLYNFFNNSEYFVDFRNDVLNYFSDFRENVYGIVYRKEQDKFYLIIFKDIEDIFKYSQEKLFDFRMINLKLAAGLLQSDIFKSNYRYYVKCYLCENLYDFVIDTGASLITFDINEFKQLINNSKLIIGKNIIFRGVESFKIANGINFDMEIYLFDIFIVSNEILKNVLIAIGGDNLLGMNYLNGKIKLNFEYNLN